MPKYILLFLTSCLLSFILAPVVRYLAFSLNIVAQPRLDRWHKKPTAMLGGVGIYLAFIISFFVFKPVFSRQIFGFLCAGSLIFFFGLIDDIIHLKPQIKLLGQIIASCVAIYFGILPKFEANPLLLIIITIIWIVGITNSLNLLDNMDGLASGVAGIAFVFIFIATAILRGNPVGLLSLIMAGAVLGFLPYNFNPAKVFMGDSGSMFLGFGLACLTLIGEPISIPNLIATLLIPVLILAVPIFDTTLVTLVRILKGKSILEGGKDHVSHRLVSLGLSEKKAVLLLYFLSILFGLIAISYSKVDVIILTVLSTLTLVVLLFFGIFLSEIETYKESQIDKERLKKIREGKIVLNTIIVNKRKITEVLVDLVLVCVAYYGAYLLRYEGKLNSINLILIKDSLPWFIMIRMACFWKFGLYRGIWRYIGINDLISIFKAVSLSTIFMILTVTFFFRFRDYSRVVFVIDWLLLLFFLTSIRIFIRVMDEQFSHYRTGKKKILIIGAGDAGELLLREIKRNAGLNYNPVGFIDDNHSKLGRTIHGVPVLGTRSDMEGIVRDKGIEEVIVAIPSAAPGVLDEIFQICSGCSVPYREVNGMIKNDKG